VAAADKVKYEDDDAFFEDEDISSDDDDILSVVDNAPPGQLLDVLLSNLAEKHADEFDEEKLSLMDDMIKHIDEKMDGNLKMVISNWKFRKIHYGILMLKRRCPTLRRLVRYTRQVRYVNLMLVLISKRRSIKLYVMIL